MKKRTVFIFLLLMGCHDSYGQLNPIPVELHMNEFTVLDNARWRVTYAINGNYDHRPPFEDTHVVLIGERMSRHFSAPFMEHAEEVTRNTDPGKKGGSYKHYDRAAYQYDFYRNHPSAGTMTVVSHLYEDADARFDWTPPVTTDDLIAGKYLLVQKGKKKNYYLIIT